MQTEKKILIKNRVRKNCLFLHCPITNNLWFSYITVNKESVRKWLNYKWLFYIFNMKV